MELGAYVVKSHHKCPQMNAKQPLKRVLWYHFKYPFGYPGFKIPENQSTGEERNNNIDDIVQFSIKSYVALTQRQYWQVVKVIWHKTT